MGSSTYAADLTREVLSKKTEEERRAVLKPYDDWCEAAIPALNQLNVVRTILRYVFFRGGKFSLALVIVQLRLLQGYSSCSSSVPLMGVLRWSR
jgi:hypothetical protein